MHRVRYIAAIAAAAVLASGPRAGASTPSVSDSLYQAHHPSILFTATELPTLRLKLSDGGEDDDAYSFLRFMALNSYAHQTPANLVNTDFGMHTIPTLGLVAWAETPFDTALGDLGRATTLYLVDTYEPDYDEFGSSLRLRSLVLGYDLFFHDAPESLRTLVLDEIVDYVDLMSRTLNYYIFSLRPYLGNHSAMVAGALGMAAVSLQDQIEAALQADALEFADRICQELIQHQFDPDGAYKEGAFYALWTMENLVYYFHARKRYDGYAYSDVPRIRALENALAFELLPEGNGRSNNLNDSNYATVPLARSTTYFDWAMSEWSSELCRWLWDRVAGAYGVDAGTAADKVGTALWHQPLAMTHPDSALSNHLLWVDRGLYYYRTGWQSAASSDDVLFSFYSGKFHGGHAQEDQNQFTLYGYGEKFAIDHGSGNLAKQSEAHNMVFVDGAGQHNAGGSIGTDGVIAEYLLSEFADYLLGDATAAYTTYSQFNNNDWPLTGIDWSWGHHGANPVLYAHRRVVVVHGSGTPYFVIMDDIDKDGTPHEYEWRLHTAYTNAISTAGNPIVIDGANASLDIHVVHPPFDSLIAETGTYNNLTTEPDSRLLMLRRTEVNPRFCFLLFPRGSGTPVPTVARHDSAWGHAVTLDWGGGVSDHVLRNDGGGLVSYAGIETDAELAVVRVESGTIAGFLALGMGSLSLGDTVYAECADGTMGCALWNGVVDIDRPEADYRVRDLGVTRVRYRDQALGFVEDDGYVLPDGVTGIRAAPAPPARIDVSAYPNPFNPATTIRIRVEGRELVTVTVYDVAGRVVRRLWSGGVAGERDVHWDGRNDDGRRVASGAYLVRVRSHDSAETVKTILIK